MNKSTSSASHLKKRKPKKCQIPTNGPENKKELGVNLEEINRFGFKSDRQLGVYDSKLKQECNFDGIKKLRRNIKNVIANCTLFGFPI